MTLIAALAVALNLLLAQTMPVLTLEHVAELEEGLNLNSLLYSPLATYVPDHDGGLPPVNEMSRNYEIAQWEGRAVIVGRYTPAIAEDDPYVLNGLYCCGRSPFPLGAHIGQGRDILDGGCGVVWVMFDPRTNRPMRVWCNGLA
jgi:hypothetical protein